LFPLSGEAGIDKRRADRFGIPDRDAEGSNSVVPDAGNLVSQREFGDPEFALVLDSSLGTVASDGGA
jgi:hypothetical protein